MLADLPFNLFDGAVVLCLIVATLSGLRTGLMRSLATILAYAVAAPLAVVLMPYVLPLVNERFQFGQMQTPIVLFAIFLIIGLVLAALLRGAVGEVTGRHVGLFDRTAGALLGAVRIILVAILIVLVFDRVIPADREPAFLAGSKLRPILSQAGAQGLRQLPPHVIESIDRIKREHGL
ncbi:CvpA family protein [Undibacter mobilis]|uniref:CvpA family protein n=1 Tax=Undibacter mobilis TaxID=2292256 RepID=A0A371BB85_9BRAD|nr:CvpA family protein [Undibacter mobilis]RDV04824.1 CvpA family protein [Undibacter mobilis]